MFCLFADDTGIFEPDHFIKYIVQRTNPDGSDLGLHLEKIFEVLNKQEDKRLKTIDEQLNKFPYVDGNLFEEHIDTVDFDSAMREAIINSYTLDWGKISPAVFGAMFQSVMNATQRHDMGAHYTSEGNILKLIHPLFLDDLWTEFAKIKKLTSDVRKERLMQFHEKITSLKFLDPACGCGNFLVISYRELRLLEIELIRELLPYDKLLDIDHFIKVNVYQFYVIEIEEFPAKIAQTAMWLMDHQMNMEIRERFGEYFKRIPLLASASIHCTNSLTTDWESIVPKNELSYILGNPPFLGSKIMNEIQRNEVYNIFTEVKNCGILDYVTCWYGKATEYIQNSHIEVAFVSTNSICQGEQVPALWKFLMNKSGIKINFAHQTFKWWNEARGKAAVYCVIVGFSLSDKNTKKIYNYSTVTSKPVETNANNINAYLIDAPMIFIESRTEPLCKVLPMSFGNMPLDGGNFLFSDEEKAAFLANEPDAKRFIKPYISAKEVLNGGRRWCLWLKGIEPVVLRKLPEVMKRIDAVRKFRLASPAPSTQNHANRPSEFRDLQQPHSFILIPRVSSGNRKYIPMSFFNHNSIAGDTCMVIPEGDIYHFGVLTSTMHMAWTRYVCGYLGTSYRYSKDIVYNNFPWPKPTDKQKAAIEAAAQAVLDARAQFPKSSLADLYDPLSMPSELNKAHQKLDKTIEKAYGREFDDDTQRVAYLFEVYQKLSGELFKDEKKRGKGRKR
jgi:hypothetical protein